MSKSWDLSIYDVKSWCLNVILFFSPVLIYLGEKLYAGDPINRNYAKVVAIGLLLNLLKKFITNYSKDVEV